MDLTPRDIHDRKFHDAFRGYNQEEVDLFLDDVAASFEKVFRENQTFHHRLKDLESQLSEARATEDMLKQMLVAAQKTANEAVETARAQADELVSKAQASGASIVAEAEGRAAEIVNQALARQREAVSTIEALRAFDRQHRDRLRSFMESQIRALGELTVFSPPEQPEAEQYSAASSEIDPSEPFDPGPVDVITPTPDEPLPGVTGSTGALASEMPDHSAGSEPSEARQGATGSQVVPPVVPPATPQVDPEVVPEGIREEGIEAASSETQAYAIPEDPDLPVSQPTASPALPEAADQQEREPEKEPSDHGPKPERNKDEELSIDELFWGERKR